MRGEEKKIIDNGIFLVGGAQSACATKEFRVRNHM